MKTKLLFPNQLKKIGWIILIPMSILGLVSMFIHLQFKFLNLKVFAIYSSMVFEPTVIFGVVKQNIAFSIIGILCILGAIFVAFSKEKYEDEYIAKIRLESLVWAIYINYAILLFCFLFFFGLGFLYVMLFNMFTILIFFIIRFYYILYKTKKSLRNEK